MHREFRSGLDDAIGRSDWIVVVTLDIRGFSDFSSRQESPNVAMYIKRVYTRLIDEYFSSASYFKPTGDGLLVTIPFTQANVKEVSRGVISSCLKCLSDFPTMCNQDPMVNFNVPTRLGIGVARGTACCLRSGEKTLDYSGQLLNLSARLMDLARPLGIVIDGAFGMDLLDKPIQDGFGKDKVFVRGISETTPREVFYLKNFVVIPETARHPVNEDPWHSQKVVDKVKAWKKITVPFRIPLEKEPKSPESINVFVEFADGRLKGTFTLRHTFTEFEFIKDAGKAAVRLNTAKLIELLVSEAVRPNATVSILISFQCKLP